MPWREDGPIVDAVVMAAGLSRRMGRNKLLLPLGETTVFQQFMESFPYDLFRRVIVVASDPYVCRVTAGRRVVLCENTHPELGKSHTIRLGLSRATGADGIIFVVADQPLLTGATIATLLEEFYRSPDSIILPMAGGKPQNPVIFPADLFDELRALSGDEGGKLIIGDNPDRVRTVSYARPAEFMDIDTVTDYQTLVTLWNETDL